MEIQLAQSNQIKEIFSILCNCKTSLDRQRIFQWIDSYPTLSTVENDIKNSYAYCAVVGNKCVGTISIYHKQGPEYAAVTWNVCTDNVLVVHRLAVDPSYQGQGIAKKLMDFTERYGIDNNFSAIRLDAFSGNKQALKFYENRGYKKCGEVFFPGRELPFLCYELAL